MIIFLEYWVLELSELHMYETYYKVVIPNLGDLELPYMDCYSMFPKFQTKHMNTDLNKLDYFLSSNLE